MVDGQLRRENQEERKAKQEMEAEGVERKGGVRR